MFSSFKKKSDGLDRNAILAEDLHHIKTELEDIRSYNAGVLEGTAKTLKKSTELVILMSYVLREVITDPESSEDSLKIATDLKKLLIDTLEEIHSYNEHRSNQSRFALSMAKEEYGNK